MDPLYLTKGQCIYLASDPTDLVITNKDEHGWIFVEQAITVGEEGSGVWVNANGNEQHGPTG